MVRASHLVGNAALPEKGVDGPDQIMHGEASRPTTRDVPCIIGQWEERPADAWIKKMGARPLFACVSLQAGERGWHSGKGAETNT